MKKIELFSPPPFLVLARVLFWASTEHPVEYTGNMLFFDGGERVGPAMNLAICQYSGDREVVLFHCDEMWNVIGCSGFGMIAEMKAQAEIGYRNISDAWREMPLIGSEAETVLETAYEGVVCLFCSRRPDQVEQMFGSGKGLICIDCVAGFYQMRDKEYSSDICT